MKEDFTNYDIKPEAFINYLRYYGEHFNRKLCDFACEEMGGKDYTKEKLDELFKGSTIKLEGKTMHDYVYVANWLKHTFYGSSILNEKQLLSFIRDELEKEGDLIFNRWYADMAKKGIPIEWEEMI